jgi:CheY-like chemotaxis protein
MADRAVILVVEDQEDDIFLVRKAFKNAGVPNPIHVVRDGQEALDYLSGQGKYAHRDEYPLPDLILLDLKMPRMDGFQVLQWLRQQTGISAIPVIVLTSSDQVWEINTAYALGANSFLVKPGDFDDYKNLAEILQTYWLKTVRRPESSRPQKIRQRDSTPNRKPW